MGHTEPSLLWNVRVVGGTERAAVELAGGRIAGIGDARGDAPADALDCEGGSLMPGLVDAHWHLSSDISRSPGFGPPPALHGDEIRPRELGYFVLAKAAGELLRAGVTTLRDVGSYDDEAIAVRMAVELGVIDGPRVLSCGRIISATSPGGWEFGTMYCQADGPWGMRQAVREQIRRGADFIKLMATGARSVVREDPEPAQMTREEIDAIVDEAHRMGKRVAAHAEGLDGTRLAVEAGVDTIEHGLSLHREPRVLEQMAERGIVLVPTLSTFHDLAERFVEDFPTVLVEQAKRQLEEAYLTLVAARDAGVVLAMGHDSGPPGANAIELVRMAEGGIGAAAAIEAATSGSARALGLEDEVGTVEPGKVADLIVVDGDPLADVRVLTDRSKIRLVLKDGRAVSPPR
jgi:imidazolonepropionase-like amidohydrolase